MQLVLLLIPEDNKEILVFRTQVGSTWSIRLTHSVEKTPWEDFFRVNGAGEFTMTETHFESLGWGYPYSPSEGKLTHTEDGKYILKMNRPYKDVALRISEQAMPHFLYENEDLDLIKKYGQGTAVTVKCRYRYQYWLDN